MCLWSELTKSYSVAHNKAADDDVPEAVRLPNKGHEEVNDNQPAIGASMCALGLIFFE